MSWYPTLNDPSLQYISPEISDPSFRDSIIFKERETFQIWKSKCERFKTLFIKFNKSDYIYATVPGMNNKIIGVWDIADNKGYEVVGTFEFNEFYTIKTPYLIIPANCLNKSDQEIFSPDDSSALKRIEKHGKEILISMMCSAEYKNIPSSELAIRAVKAAGEYDDQFRDYSRLYFQMNPEDS